KTNPPTRPGRFSNVGIGRPAILTRPRRAGARYANAALSSVIGAVMLASAGPTAQTYALFSLTSQIGSNAIGSAKNFALFDVSAVASSGGQVLISWSDASWATAGYSVRRGTSSSGPFTQVGSAV